MSKLLDLDAYVTGELEHADAFEEAMFDAPDDPDLLFVDRLARHGRRLAEHGTFDIGVSRDQLDVLRAKGLDVKYIDAGGPTSELRVLQIPMGGDLLATSLLLGRTDLDRVDVEINILEHQVTKVLKDVLVDRSDGRIYALCERPLADLALLAGPTLTKVRHRDVVIGEWHIHGQPA